MRILLIFFCFFATVENSPAQEPTVPAGFTVREATEPLGRGLRHIAVRESGELYGVFQHRHGGIVALRDEDGDKKFEVRERIDFSGGSGLEIFRDESGEWLYASTPTEVFRWKLEAGELIPKDKQLVVGGFPDQRSHNAKSLAISAGGDLFVNSGAPSNACQTQDRAQGSPGQRPCPQLERGGGIWRFAANGNGQDQVKDGERFAVGLRNSVAMAVNPLNNKLYAVPHGRDQLQALFPKLYSHEDSAELPAEEMHLLERGANAGWPYTYWDHRSKQRIVAPEYGGDGKKVYEGKEYQEPIAALPGHWAPNDLLFYTGKMFPEKYYGGAFIAFHGSWNRAPLPQQGYNVVFIPFAGDKPNGGYEIFADNFAGSERLRQGEPALARPMGLAQAPDGALYVSDSKEGRIWRIEYSPPDKDA